jgi:CheY-like chemotaxis protein
MKRILIIEDNADNRARLSAALRPEGYEILTAASSLEGVEMAQHERPDLILTDVTLASLNGYEAVRRLKALRETRHIPILAISAHATPGERERALNAGCDGYLADPMDMLALPQQVRLFLR